MALYSHVVSDEPVVAGGMVRHLYSLGRSTETFVQKWRNANPVCPVQNRERPLCARRETGRNRPGADIDTKKMNPVAARLLRIGMAMGACAVLAACGPKGLGPWQEEVRLSDGRKIVVERYEESVVRKPIADVGAAFLTRTTLRFVAPPELATLPVLSTQYRPLILDFDPAIGTWFVIAFDERVCQDRIRKRDRGEMDATGLINLRPNFEYRLIGGQWLEVPLGPERIGLPVNLLIQRMTVESWKTMRRPVPLEEKQRLDSHPRVPTEYRKIEPTIGCG